MSVSINRIDDFVDFVNQLSVSVSIRRDTNKRERNIFSKILREFRKLITVKKGVPGNETERKKRKIRKKLDNALQVLRSMEFTESDGTSKKILPGLDKLPPVGNNVRIQELEDELNNLRLEEYDVVIHDKPYGIVNTQVDEEDNELLPPDWYVKLSFKSIMFWLKFIKWNNDNKIAVELLTNPAIIDLLRIYLRCEIDGQKITETLRLKLDKIKEISEHIDA